MTLILQSLGEGEREGGRHGVREGGRGRERVMEEEKAEGKRNGDIIEVSRRSNESEVNGGNMREGERSTYAY